jgi:MoaA/NifB/PqqE/SkfB family radical SAM enzyme
MRIPKEELTKNGKIIQLFYDFVICEDVCNMQCKYCLTPETPFAKDSDGFKWSQSKARQMRYEDGYQIKTDIDNVIDSYYGIFDSPVLKLSGGEILLLKNLVHLIEKESQRFESIQVLSNATLIDEGILNDIKCIPNVTFQLSLDGHTLEMNGYRARNEVIHNKILKNLDAVVEKGIPVELNCVVHDRNANKLDEFVKYLLEKYGDKVVLMPFPIRNNAKKLFGASKNNINGLNKLIDNYDIYKSIVPPLKYLICLRDFISGDSINSIRCYTPFFVLQSFENGITTPCPLMWSENLGNILEEKEMLLDQFGTSGSFHLRTLDPPRLPDCKHCFTDIYVYSLFFNDLISLDELLVCRPLYARPKAKKRLVEFHEIFSKHKMNQN